MVSSSKILTVSYGTFSCTAEGFEDPLAVVKETTQFFRGVVGEDRFFGAEPPQFDPELATEMMRQRLTDDMGDGKLSIGQAALAGGATSAGALSAALASDDTLDPASDLLPDDDTIEATAILSERLDEPALQDDSPTAPLSADVPDLEAAQIEEPRISGSETAPALRSPTSEEDVTAKLDRIRAVVSEQPPQDLAEELPENTPENTAPEEAEAPQPVAAPVASDDSDLEALLGDLTEDAPVEAAEIADTPEATPEPDQSDAADPAEKDGSAITAAVTGALAAGAAALGATMLAKDDAPVQDNETSQAQPEPAPETDTVSETNTNDQDDDALLNSLSETLAGVMDTPADAPDLDTDLTALDGDDLDKALETSSDAALDAALKDLSAWDNDAQAEAAPTESAPVETPEPVAETASDAPAEPKPETPAVAEPVAVATPAPKKDLAKGPTRARVVKVKRVDFEKAVQSGAFEEVPEDTPATAPTTTPTPQSTLSAEDEDELSRELAAVKAELDGAPTDTAGELNLGGFEVDTPAADPAPLRLDNPIEAPDLEDVIADEVRSSARKAVKLASPARALLTEKSVEDHDASRLMQQADTEMDEPEGNRRRTALAHLRAAVEATKAERSLGPRAVPTDGTEAYREDLANVVRPRRPQSGSARTERPQAENKPTPLKLVPENRIDETPAQPVAPVRPRRVARAATSARPALNEVATPAAQPTGNAAPGGFAEFARSMGATELPELLEAAAAYMSFVEGLEQFSRPQLMRTVSELENIEYSREDRLRNFGQLLREGKIEKTEGGRFVASARNSFRPSQTAV
ncbi:MAG: hypothetical protein N4A70_19840 [Pelagimonas sp.]|jgi:hypothetical protein|nr:hypothetical protein [Pelagimonas sp.]